MTQALKLSLNEIVATCRERDRPIGLVTGVFDLLHQGHLLFLSQAQTRMKELGGCLVVGVESDSRVKKLKGADRPIDSQEVRVRKLVETHLADLVFILPSKFDTQQDHLELIKKLQPTVLLVSEHTPFLEQKNKLMQVVGGAVEVICERDPRFSTTMMIK
jgi:cytidyltransferase-like protein